MGCVNPNQKKKSRQLPNQGSKIGMIDNVNFNSFPSQIILNQPSNIQVNSEEGKDEGTGDDPIIVDDDFDKSHIATSKIYRRSNSLSKRDSKQKDYEEEEPENDTITQQPNSIYLGVPPSKEQIMEGVIREEIGFSEIHIYTPSMAMEFSIPKSYAGPLIIPFVNYELYQSEITNQ